MIDIILKISCLISVFYLTLILLLAIGVNKLKSLNGFKNHQQNSFSVIVPFRNEATHLPKLLQSVINLAYPNQKFEIILVNDNSTDASEIIVKQFIEQYSTIQISLIQNTFKVKSPKKEAIEMALKTAQFEWIITTDADCILPNKWLNSFDYLIQTTFCDMIVAPVIFSSDNSFFQDFQQLDFLSLMGATQGGFGIGAPFLCNGANLCYRKSVFLEVNGFEGNTNIASGDDVFLMEKFLRRRKTCVKYLKSADAIVQTSPQKTLKEFVNQRIRWASKTTDNKNNTAKIVGIIVLSMNFLLLLSLLFLKWIPLFKILLLWMIKVIVDYALLWAIAPFYQTSISIKKYLIFSFIYPFYTLFIVVLSLWKGYNWKGRRF